jgi:electron-transferring-flavoprotein dehydrogenase
VIIGDMGVDKEGNYKDTYVQGIEIRAAVTVLGEGCRGHLSKRAIKQIQAGRRLRPADLRHRHEGALAAAGRPGRAGPDPAHRRLAAAGQIYGGSFVYHLDK